MVMINIGRKEAVFFGVIVLVFAVVGFGVAIGSDNWQVHGHDAGEIEGAVGGGTSTVVLGAFGDWEAKSSGTTYTASTDGIVVAHGIAFGTAEGAAAYGYTDGNLVAKFNSNSGDWDSSTMTFPVKKGDTWKITTTSSVSVKWMPIESRSSSSGGEQESTLTTSLTTSYTDVISTSLGLSGSTGKVFLDFGLSVGNAGGDNDGGIYDVAVYKNGILLWSGDFADGKYSKFTRATGSIILDASDSDTITVKAKHVSGDSHKLYNNVAPAYINYFEL